MVVHPDERDVAKSPRQVRVLFLNLSWRRKEAMIMLMPLRLDLRLWRWKITVRVARIS